MTFGCFVFDELLFIGRHLRLYLGITSWQIVISALFREIQNVICQQQQTRRKNQSDNTGISFSQDMYSSTFNNNCRRPCLTTEQFNSLADITLWSELECFSLRLFTLCRCGVVKCYRLRIWVFRPSWCSGDDNCLPWSHRHHLDTRSE